MKRIQFFKKFLMPCGICAAVPAIKPSQAKEEAVKVNNSQETPNIQKLIRPSELPIYTFEKSKSETRETLCKPAEPSVVEQKLGKVRKSFQDFFKQFDNYKGAVSNTIDTGYAHSKVTLDYLREETNVLPRFGAVGIGGLSGFILALRGGKFKKLVYTSTGALVVASICYPKQAQEGLTLTKYYANVGYNFLYGVKPGEKNQLELSWPELPKVPTSFSEFKDVATSAAGSAASAAGTLVNKAVKTFNDFSEMPTPPGEPKKTDKSDN